MRIRLVRLFWRARGDGGRVMTHLLERDARGRWLYGERTCLSDTCQHVTHAVWSWQGPVTEDEARQIVALFRSRYPWTRGAATIRGLEPGAREERSA